MSFSSTPIAKVVIDLKAKNIDKEYDYLIPNELINLINIGSRVIVPFGNQVRMAFVVEIVFESEHVLREIIDVIDPTPILNEELLLIYEYIKSRTNSFKSSILSTIIPTEYLMDYQKEVHHIQGDLPKNLVGFFNKNNTWKLRKKDNLYFNQLKTLSDNKIIKITTTLKQKGSSKTIIGYRLNHNHKYKRIDNYGWLADIFKDEQLVSRIDLIDKKVSVSAINTLVKNNVLIKEDIRLIRKIKHDYQLIDKDVLLNDDQNQAFINVKANFNNYCEFLLKGVTASGKTEVYLKLIEEVLKKDKKALILVPEINLIAQLAMRLESLFEDKVAILNSNLSSGEKYDQYQKILNNEIKIVLGTRSASFVPLEDLGIIIMDEEHDESYEQRDGVYYDTKEIIKIRAKYHNVPILYGSATPSIEMMYKVKNKQIKLLELPEKALTKEENIIEIIDIKDEIKKGNYNIISTKLDAEIKARLTKDEQIMLLINRKGYAPYVMCKICGSVPVCPNCQVSLTYYKNENLLKCHYCGFEKEYSSNCSSCNNDSIKEVGIAIEQVEKVVKEKYPEAKVIRMDKTTTTKKGSHESLWYKFYKKDADILIGTQMIAKGLDYENVTLVGVLQADQDLKIPAYNQDEKTYTLLKQMIGRTGRTKQGLAIIQTYEPNNFIIKSLKKDYNYYYEETIAKRILSNYPPISQMGYIVVLGESYFETYKKAFIIKKELTEQKIISLGPVQSYILKHNNLYSFKVTVKYKEDDYKTIFETIKNNQTNKYLIRFDPYLDIA